MRNFFLGLSAAAGALTLAMAATPASAAVTLLEPGCDLYSAQGCLFSHGGGGEFDDADLIELAYNLTHLAAPPPEDLPANFAILGKSDEGGIVFDDNGLSWTFTNLPFPVSFYSIKAGSDEFLLFGLNPASNSFTATNTRLLNPGGQVAEISHVTFFGGGDSAIPEPSTWAMMIMGFGSVGAIIRRRRQSFATVSA